jgi:uncharacterized Zn finger protein
VMERVCREADGLFPAPPEIKMSCSCPDWADMCKHVAATLYGVGARLDADPDLIFTLRGVDRTELVSTVGADLPLTEAAAASERVLADDDVAALFGIEMAAPDAPSMKQSHEAKKQARERAAAPAPIPPKKPWPVKTNSGAARAKAPVAVVVAAPAKAAKSTIAAKLKTAKGAVRPTRATKPRAPAPRP